MEDFYWMIWATCEGIKFNRVPLKLHYKRKHVESHGGWNRKEILRNVPLIRQEIAKAFLI